MSSSLTSDQTTATNSGYPAKPEQDSFGHSRQQPSTTGNDIDDRSKTNGPTRMLPEILTWDEALQAACWQHKSLAVSSECIFAQATSVLRPPNNKNDSVTITNWKEPSLLEWVQKNYNTLLTTSATSKTALWHASTSFSSRVYEAIFTSPIKYLLGPRKEEFEEEHERALQGWAPDAYDKFHQNLIESNATPDPKALIASVVMITKLLRELESALEQQEPIVLAVKGPPPNDWFKYLRQYQKHQSPLLQLTAELPQEQQFFLLKCLDVLKIVDYWERPEHEKGLVLIGLPPRNHEETRVKVACFDLEVAQHKLEQQIDSWTRQMSICTQRALDAKKHNHTQRALLEMKRRQLLHKQIETSYSKVLNIESSLHALQQAASHKNILRALEQSNETLHFLRESTSLERVDDVLDDLQEEMEHLEKIDVSLSSVSPVLVDEDELLRELEAMTLRDASEVALSAAAPTEESLPKKERSKSREDAMEDEKIAIPS